MRLPDRQKLSFIARVEAGDVVNYQRPY